MKIFIVAILALGVGFSHGARGSSSPTTSPVQVDVEDGEAGPGSCPCRLPQCLPYC